MNKLCTRASHRKSVKQKLKFIQLSIMMKICCIFKQNTLQNFPLLTFFPRQSPSPTPSPTTSCVAFNWSRVLLMQSRVPHSPPTLNLLPSQPKYQLHSSFHSTTLPFSNCISLPFSLPYSNPLIISALLSLHQLFCF
jgi:uncharacterized protein VirK/YbjX